MMFTQWITSQVSDGPDSDDLLTKVMPDYPATGKRTLQDNGSLRHAATGQRRTGAYTDPPDYVPAAS